MSDRIVILKDTIPESYPGVVLHDRFGTGYGFGFDTVRKKDLYFQPQVFLQILDSSEKTLFEYRTLTYLLCKKRIEEYGFFEEIYASVLSAIDEFDRKLATKKSVLTLYKRHTPIPTIEQAKKPIRQAYLMLNFNERTSNN